MPTFCDSTELYRSHVFVLSWDHEKRMLDSNGQVLSINLVCWAKMCPSDENEKLNFTKI